MNEVTYRGTWAGPRWLKVGPAIKNAAHMTGVAADVEVDKGWIRESGRYTLRGEESAVDAIVDWLKRAMEENNKD